MQLFLLLIMGAILAQAQQQNLIIRAVTGQGPAVAAKYSLTVLHKINSTGDVALVNAGDAPTTQAFLTAAQTDPLIQSVETDVQRELGESDSSSEAASSIVSGAADPLVIGSTDPITYYGNLVRSGYAKQAVTTLVHIPDAQSAFGIGAGIVAIIDTGIDPTHPALAGAIVSGYDFVNNLPGIPSELADVSASTVALLDQASQPQPASSQTPFMLNASTVALLDASTVALLDASTVALLDGNNLPEAFGHGTMVAGLIHLVAPGAKIMPLKAFHADGSGNMSDIVQAIYYATDHGAKVINMSFSATTSSPALAAAITYARSHKVISIASAGNQGKGAPVYPAAAGAIGVASINAAGSRSFFSNYGDTDARTSAPGEALLTTYPGGGYAGVWGTSFSAALVSGTAALMTKIAPRASQGDFSDAMEHGKKIPGQNIGDASLDVLAVLQAYKADN